MIYEYLLQFFVSFFIGFISRFKWLIGTFIALYVVLLGFALYFEPAVAGETLHEGLFTLWRWVITIPAYILGSWLSKKLKGGE